MSKFVNHSVIITGPQGCGKTKNAEALRIKYGMKRIKDGWSFRSYFQFEDVLYLTNEEPPKKYPYAHRVVTFEDAMAAPARRLDPRRRNRLPFKFKGSL